jgi:hypothetical protein
MFAFMNSGGGRGRVGAVAPARKFFSTLPLYKVAKILIFLK